MGAAAALVNVSRRHAMLAIGALALACIIAATLLTSIRLSGGHLVYGLDDAYIHMAIAKNLVSHHIWGVTRYQFSGASSSPLYTSVLAAVYVLTGPVAWAPLALNLVFAFMLLILLAHLFRRSGYSAASASALALLVVVLMPATALIMGGMEHLLHAFLAVVFVHLSAEALSSTTAIRGRNRLWLILAAAALPVARYESLALIAAFIVLALLRRRPSVAAEVGIAGVTPVVLYGLASLAAGGYFIPNSILMKTQPMSLVPQILVPLSTPGSHMALPLISALALLIWHLASGSGIWSYEQVLLSMVLAAAAAHFQFAGFGSLYRYEAYLVCLLYFALIIAARPAMLSFLEVGVTASRARRGLLIGCACAFVLIILGPSLIRAASAFRHVPRASNNIYSQQYQMASFVRKYYSGRTIAANDIGAIDYYADVHLLDLVGLASGDVTIVRRRSHGSLRASSIDRLAKAHGADIAVIYDSWFPDGLPSHWQKAGQWRIDCNFVCGDSRVTFYSIDGDPRSRHLLEDRLSAYAPLLPATASSTPSAD